MGNGCMQTGGRKGRAPATCSVCLANLAHNRWPTQSPNNCAHAAATTCKDIQDAFDQIRADAANTCAKVSHTIQLISSCGQAIPCSNQQFRLDGLDACGGTNASNTVSVTLKAAPACSASRRLTMSLNASNGAPLFYLNSTRATLALQSVVVNTLRSRVGLTSLRGRGVTLKDVDFANCGLPSSGLGAVATYEGTTVQIKGGAFRNNFGSTASSLYVDDVRAAPAGTLLSVSNTLFTANVADYGHVYINKRSPNAREAVLRGCQFRDNGFFSGSRSCMITFVRLGDKTDAGEPGQALTLDLTKSVFRGEGAAE
jgi:hypothetical protein